MDDAMREFYSVIGGGVSNCIWTGVIALIAVMVLPPLAKALADYINSLK
jgi:hypothetical protein